MKVENLNVTFRELFKELMNDGYKKKHVCGITLGASAEPQFENFVRGADFGLKPLQRIIQNMGYNLDIILVPKSDKEITKFVEDVNKEFFSSCKEKIVEKLDDKEIVRAASIPKTGIIATVSSELFDEITK